MVGEATFSSGCLIDDCDARLEKKSVEVYFDWRFIGLGNLKNRAVYS